MNPNAKLLFHLARNVPPQFYPIYPYPHCRPLSLYEQIKLGRKRSEWRDATPYWLKRLCRRANLAPYQDTDLTQHLKVTRVWFVQGYPQGNLPRIEADIIGLIYRHESHQLEIQFTNCEEVKR